MTKKQLCINCQHFYVTWDSSFPYGCKGFGMKSKNSPSLVVFQTSGQPCMVYEAKSEKMIEDSR